jgi:hypothetical protein
VREFPCRVPCFTVGEEFAGDWPRRQSILVFVSVPEILEDIPDFGLITATKNLLEDLFRGRRFEILKNLQEFPRSNLAASCTDARDLGRSRNPDGTKLEK